MSEEDEIHISGGISLSQLTREAEGLCEKLDVDFNPRKIRVTTDFGTNIVIYYEYETDSDC